MNALRRAEHASLIDTFGVDAVVSEAIAANPRFYIGNVDPGQLGSGAHV